MKKDFLSIYDLSPDELKELLEISIKFKKGEIKDLPLKGKMIALIFQKPSLRTRVTFERAIYDLGGKGVYLSPQDIQLGKRESVKDIARNLSNWTDGIVARVFHHGILLELAKYTKHPVINALSDLEHPCQILADYMTMYEISGKFNVNLAYIGDGNNVANSLLAATALLGGKFTIATPYEYEPNGYIVKRAMELGVKFEIVRDPKEAVKDADFIYTDVWASMGQESEREKRLKLFAPYQVNSELLKHAPSHVKVLHCLPAHRGEEITDEVLDGPHSAVLQESENRLHTEKAVLYKLFS